MREDLPPIHVGDHVTDREDGDDDSATMLVVGVPVEQADEYIADGEGPTAATVADYNEGYPADDDVVECVYPQRTDTTLRTDQTYAFPRSRVALETPLHDIDADQEDDRDA
jgi:hypothetical protein